MTKCLGIFLWLALAFLGRAEAAAQSDPWDGSRFLSAGAPAPTSEERFSGLPDFTFESASGGTLSLGDMAGKVWIAVPFFVRCAGPCPSITRDIQERLLPGIEGTGIEVVSFSLDPQFDSPERLAEYADGLGIPLNRWHFVSSSSEEEMHRFVQEGLKVPVGRDPDADDPGLAITHGTRMPVIDQAGQIAGFYDLADPSRARSGGASPMSLSEAEPILEGRFGLIIDRARALAGAATLGPSQRGRRSSSPLPLFNALLNAISAVLLVLGFVAIKGGRKHLHATLMRAAFVASATFLASYLYYHFVVLPISGGPTKFGAEGTLKVLYLVVLASHVLLAMVNLPMVLRVLWLAHKGDWERHKRLAKWTLPIWLYVSVTGVAVYLALYQFNPAA